MVLYSYLVTVVTSLLAVHSQNLVFGSVITDNGVKNALHNREINPDIKKKFLHPGGIIPGGIHHPQLSISQTMKNLHEKLTMNHQAKNSDNTKLFKNVQELFTRVLKRGGVKWADDFHPDLELINYEQIQDGSEQLRDVFEIDVNKHTGNLIFRGSSGVALTTAFGHYLRYYTKADISWENAGGYSFDTLHAYQSVKDLPTPKKNSLTVDRHVFLSKYRYYQNTCTTSYSLVWRNWNEWEMEIDWMAINGINLPLAFTGQERIWYELWNKEYGISEDVLLNSFFSGPAFLTWQRMANLRGYGGPLPFNSWIEEQFILQKQILKRFSELDIIPVLPAFNGVVPPELQQQYPNANITRMYPSWNQFPDQYCCDYMLSATDPLFQEIGSKFIELQKTFYAEDGIQLSHIYNSDTFNENKPASNNPDYLSSASYAVYASIRAVDPDAVWLMQGWLLVNDPFWQDPANVANYLSGVPDDGMIVLDLAAEDLPIWSKVAANHKPFIWCMLHNYGGRRSLYGNLSTLTHDPYEVQAQVPGYFLGTGLTMEAIDQNPIMYEMMNEVAYHTKSFEVTGWVEEYVTRRYGLAAPTITTSANSTLTEEVNTLAHVAWSQLVVNNYLGETPVCHHYCHRESILTQRPSWQLSQTNGMLSGPLVDIWQTLERVGQLSTQVASNIAYRYDLVDVSRQVIANLFFDAYQMMKTAYNRQDASNFQSISRMMVEMVNDMDSILSSHPHYLLGRWISDARRWAAIDPITGEINESEANLYDFNARNQITLWGDDGEIDDYAMKQWGGLLSGYYQHRWELFFSYAQEAIRTKVSMNITAFQQEEIKIGQKFCHDYATVFPTEATGDSLSISNKLQGKYGNLYEQLNVYEIRRDSDVSGGNLVSIPMWTKNIKQLEILCDVDATCVGFTSEGYLKKFIDTSSIAKKNGVDVYLKKTAKA